MELGGVGRLKGSGGTGAAAPPQGRGGTKKRPRLVQGHLQLHTQSGKHCKMFPETNLVGQVGYKSLARLDGLGEEGRGAHPE